MDNTRYSRRLLNVMKNLDFQRDIGIFDVCLLNNNIYYFNPDQRITLPGESPAGTDVFGHRCCSRSFRAPARINA